MVSIITSSFLFAVPSAISSEINRVCTRTGSLLMISATRDLLRHCLRISQYNPTVSTRMELNHSFLGWGGEVSLLRPI